MNWILENKKKNSSHGTILQKAKLWWGRISRDKKTKALLVVLILVCGFFVAALTAHAVVAVPGTEVDGNQDSNIFVKAAKWILMGILNFCGYLFAIAATLFSWIVDPKNISGSSGILNKQAVKDVWIMVRDTLNMFFILVLLFSAFCTIFHVEKFNLKAVWLKILINALLVNFSYPIARIIIDISNVAMYYFINNLFTTTTTVTGSSIMATLSASSGISQLLAPEQYTKAPIAYLVAMIVFTFIFGMTLLIIGALFVVRMVALTLIIMFSPVGFVGYIFPSTADLADKWWKQLFSYSFFAPIMIFGMAIAIKIAEAIKNENFTSFVANGGSNTSAGDANWVANGAFFAIPVVVLWVTMGFAKSISIAGAGKITDTGKKWGKSLATSPYKVGKWGFNKSGIPGGVKKGWEEGRKSGKLFGVKVPLLKNNLAKREAGFAGMMGDKRSWKTGTQKLTEQENRERIEKGAKEHLESGETAASLAARANTEKDVIKRAQASSAYLKLDRREKRAHTTDTLAAAAAAGSADYGDHTEALNGTLHSSLVGTPRGTQYLAEQAKAKAAADRIKGGTGTGKDHATLEAFLANHHKANVTQAVKS